MNLKIALMAAGLTVVTLLLILLMYYRPTTAPVVLGIAILMIIYGVSLTRRS